MNLMVSSSVQGFEPFPLAATNQRESVMESRQGKWLTKQGAVPFILTGERSNSKQGKSYRVQPDLTTDPLASFFTPFNQ